jgi:hypothetical protein
MNYHEKKDRFVEEIKALGELSSDELIEFWRTCFFHHNYYAWLVQYLQTAAFQLQQDLSKVRCTVTYFSVGDKVEFAIYNAEFTSVVKFTGMVTDNKLVTAHSQVLQPQPLKEITQ